VTPADQFARAYVTYLAPLRGYFYNQGVRDQRLREDLAQETFVRAWLSVHSYQEPVALRAWLFRVAHNLLVDEIRHQRPQETITDVYADPTADRQLAAVEGEPESWWMALLPQYREILVLMAEGYTPTECGRRLRLNPNAIRQLQWRARKAARKALAA